MKDIIQSILHECKNYGDGVRRPCIDHITGESFVTNWKASVFDIFDIFLEDISAMLQGQLQGHTGLTSVHGKLASTLADLKTDTMNMGYRRKFAAAVCDLHECLKNIP